LRYDIRQINAVVLAGGINPIELYKGYVPGNKALLTIGGKPLIRYSLDALKDSARVKQICIVGPREVHEAVANAGPLEHMEGGPTIAGNIYKGLKHFSGEPLVLLITADLPFVTPAAITEFLDAVGKVETTHADNVFWAVIPEESFTGPYRKVNKGYNRFRDIAVCHGNILVMTPSLAGNSRFLASLDGLYATRKNSLKAAMSMGLLIGAAYAVGVQLFRALTLGTMAGILSRHIGAGLIPVLLNRPEVAVDLDEPSDYRFVIEMLESKGTVR
jgi:molybdopterin-guanine dinucleotide biosynthesis protein A